ncbi:FGGY-family carbohydrate kinase [Mesorhizobium sp. LjNodule214]|uniref:FGGY-family carbohydrate kinase n=1 Tax=Mesorhizobium sp. LjNodule214 TaxID=3342252 RepID=UPI003ECF5533
MDMLVCGIDIGSTNLKVALFDESNRLVWLRTEPTPRVRDAVGLVTDAADLVTVIERMLVCGWAELGRGKPLVAISSAGIGEDGLYVDTTLNPLGSAIPWFDLRATAEAKELAGNAAATPLSGISIDPTRTAAKWLWSARNLPHQAIAASYWISLTDYPLAAWAGVPFMSDTLASRTGCFDPSAREWIAPLLTASRAPVLPQVVSAGTAVGTVRSSVLLDSGAADQQTLLVAGGHDHPVAAHAIHQLAANARVDSLGTANVIYGDAPALTWDAFDSKIAFMPSIEGVGKLACLGVFEFTAAVNRFPGGMEAIRRVMALEMLPGNPGTGAGDRMSTERQLLEWATMNARLMLERLDAFGVPQGPVYATGGWSRSRALLELRASVFGQPVHAPQEKELSVLGAAIFAAAAAGHRTSLDTPVAVIYPNERWQPHYAEAFERFVATDAGGERPL